jgi:uncharacterized protein YciI
MHKYYFLLLLSYSFYFQFSSAQEANPHLDTALARKLGADEYGMKMYVLVILKSGSNQDKDAHKKDSCFIGHLQNIRKLADNKQLAIAGPFEKNDADLRGIFILNVKTIEEANALLATDPAIKANYLSAELYPWYGSAAIPTYLPLHDKIWKSNP